MRRFGLGRRTVAAVVVCATVAVVVGVLSAPVGTVAGCAVTNARTGTVYATPPQLQDAVNDPAIQAADTLTVSGVCSGDTTIATSLTIEGIGRGATLTGPGTPNSGSVVTIVSGVTVTLTNLTITGGNAFQGGGIFNGGTLTLIGSTVSNNTAPVTSLGGGGIFNQGTATLIGSTVSNNTASGAEGGGGIFNSGTVAAANSLVIGNKADNGGQGGGIYSNGTLTLTNPLVTLNTATATATAGGGLYWTGTLISPTTGVIFNKPDNVN